MPLSDALKPKRSAFVPDNGEEFPAGRRVVAERAQHATRHHTDAWFADAACCHALVRRFDNDADTLWLKYLLDRVSDLCSQCFLNLQALRKDFDDPRQLRNSDDSVRRQ